MKASFALGEILKDKDISVYRLAAESGVSYSTIRRLVFNETPSIYLDVLQAILDTLCQLTGHCYDVNDIIKVHYKKAESHESLPDKPRDSIMSVPLEQLDFLPVFYTGDNRLPVTVQDICAGGDNGQ